MKTLILILLLLLLSVPVISRTNEGSELLSPLVNTRCQLILKHDPRAEECPFIKIEERSLTVRLLDRPETMRIMLKFTIEMPTQTSPLS